MAAGNRSIAGAPRLQLKDPSGAAIKKSIKEERRTDLGVPASTLILDLIIRTGHIPPQYCSIVPFFLESHSKKRKIR